jgi:hypothetical protein
VNVLLTDKVSFVIYIDEWPPQIQLTHGPHLKYDLRELLGSGSFAKVQLFVDCAIHCEENI